MRQSRARSAETMTQASAPSVSRQLSKRQSGSLIQREVIYMSRVSGRSYITASGFWLARLRQARATLKRWSRVAPYSCMYRRASIPISSAGCSSPYGRVHWAGVGSCTAVFFQGRGPDPRFRDRQATPTLACPVATAAARCAIVAQEPPPP